SDPFLHSRRKQIAALTARDAIPTISGGREWVAAGGLISYGNSIPDAYRRAGLQTGRRSLGPACLPQLPLKVSNVALHARLERPTPVGLHHHAALASLGNTARAQAGPF